MSRTVTRQVNLERLCRSQYATIILRLMAAYNDVSLANSYMAKAIDREPTGIDEHVVRGAQLYFVRLQIAHIYEALKIVKEIKNDTYLAGRVNYCSSKAQGGFRTLIEYLEGGGGHKEFDEYCRDIRNKAAFHYDKKGFFNLAFSERCKTHRISSINESEDLSLCRFNLADEVISTMICRVIWKIREHEDFQTAWKKKLEYGLAICKAFLSFSGDYLVRFVKEFAL